MNDVFGPDRCLVMDGAMGTMLQKSGLRLGERPDLLSVTAPQAVERVTRLYVQAGSDLVCANTFGTNARKLAGCGYTVSQVAEAAVACAKRACAGSGVRVMLDIGPIGELLEPAGTLQFEQAYEIFKEVMVAGWRAGADVLLLETMTDLYEVKAGILAAKENTPLPVLVSMTFEESGRTFTGCSVEAMAATAGGLGADGLGINCSMGPQEIFPLAQRLCACTPLPVFIKPNAGLPDPASGVYSVTPQQFCDAMQPYKALGISAVGGCCGTTPEYLSLLAQSFKNERPAPRMYAPRPVVCTPTRTVFVAPATVIGERINPTGKKLFKEALRAGDMDYILAQAAEQAEAGAQILDVNVGLPEIDEVDLMRRAVKAIQSVTDLPLQLDSTRPEVLEAGLRVYSGKPIVNSVNGEKKVLDAVLPLCKKYGAAVVGLTLDEKGIPESAQERFAIARRIVKAAAEAGIGPQDVYIDCLTLTASAQQTAVAETLRAVRMVKEQLGVKTVLGVSNISFGLPCREQINVSFLSLALANGLDLPIMNPNSEAMMAAVRSFRVLSGQDAQAGAYIACYGGQTPAAPVNAAQGMSLRDAVLQGLKAPAAAAARTELEHAQPEQVVNEILIPALDTVGERFERGTLFLPQLLQSAGAAQAAFDLVKERIAAAGVQGASRGRIVIATVQGDIHDIGKNIVKVILENYGYEMHDLGRDVAPQAVVAAVKKYDVRLVGLSALMTTTLPSMAKTIALLRQECPGCQTMVGGAVLTPEYARAIGADYYARDAKQSVDIAKRVLG